MGKSFALGVVPFFVQVAAAMGGGLPFDVNGDGAVDLSDHQRLALCLTSGGPGQASGDECVAVRGDGDGDIDLIDAAGFLNAFTGPRLLNDACATPFEVGNGTHGFSNVGATTDGAPDELCNYFNSDQISSDLWFCYTATCTGTALFSACGSDFDTKLAVYAGCGCPSVSPVACSDDDCGFGIENIQSRIELDVTQGQVFTIRVGGYPVSTTVGEGLLTIGCNVAPCETATHDCLEPSPGGEPGCGTAECCAGTCGLDWYCCDVTWDSKCAGEAEGICDGNFSACNAGAGACDVNHGTPGCDNVTCCNTVCFSDPFCCLTEWDDTCVDAAQAACFLTCGAGALGQGCFEEHATPGCSDETCCTIVCRQDDFCCDVEWDLFCIDKALESCP